MTQPEIAYTLGIRTGSLTTKNAQRECNCQHLEKKGIVSTLGNKGSYVMQAVLVE